MPGIILALGIRAVNKTHSEGRQIIVRNAVGRKSHLYGPLVKAFIGRSLSGRTPGGR